MKNIKFVDPPVTNLGKKRNLNSALKSGWLSHGPYVESFEKNL